MSWTPASLYTDIYLRDRLHVLIASRMYISPTKKIPILSAEGVAMACGSLTRVRKWRAILGFCATLALVSVAAADTVTLGAVKNAYGTDGGMNADPYLDGTYNWVYSGTHVYVVRQIWTNPYSERDTRSAFDFLLPPALLQPNVVINSATSR